MAEPRATGGILDIDRGLYAFVEQTPDATALIDGATRLTYSELAKWINQIARVLTRLGIEPGDSVALVMPNSPEFLATQLAALQAGVYVTLVNSHLTAPEISYILTDSEAVAVLTHGESAPAAIEASHAAGIPADRILNWDAAPNSTSLRELADRESDEPIADRPAGSVQLYSSGTTGRPKGIRRPLPTVTARQVSADMASDRIRKFGIDAADGAHLLLAPLYHAAPNNSAIGALAQGQTVVIAGKFDAEQTLALIAQHRVSTTFMVPLMFYRILALPEDIRRRYDRSSLKVVLHAGAPCPADVKRGAIDYFGEVVWEYYGSSEAGMVTLISAPEWLDRPGSVGRAAPGYELRVFDAEGVEVATGETGDVYSRGGPPFSYLGRVGEDTASWRGDFYTSGDLGYVDDAGYLFLLDRRTDLILSGGVNIYPAEVEAAIVSSEHVADTVVVGLPDEEWGSKVVAVVQLGPASTPSSELVEELRTHCGTQLAKFKIPRDFVFWDELPRTEAGKLSRSKIREILTSAGE